MDDTLKVSAMDDTLKVNDNGVDEEFKTNEQCPTESNNENEEAAVNIKMMPKRIIYDLQTDDERRKSGKNATLSRKMRNKKPDRNRKDAHNADFFDGTDVTANPTPRKREVRKRNAGRVAKDLRENINTKNNHQSKIFEAQIKVENDTRGGGNTKLSEDTPSLNDFSKEELKRDILNLKSKLEGVEARVNNNCFSTKTVTKIKCHSNYKVHMDADITKFRHLSDGSIRSRREHGRSSHNVESARRRDNQAIRKSKCDNKSRDRKEMLSSSNKNDKRSRDHKDARRKDRREYDKYRRLPKAERRVDDRNKERQLRDETKSRGRYPNGSLSQRRRQVAKHEDLESRNEVRRNKSQFQPREKRFLTSTPHLNENNEKEYSKGHDYGYKGGHTRQITPQEVSKLLLWPQLKSSPKKESVPFENGLTLRQDAFGLHPDVNPKVPNVIPPNSNNNLRIYDTRNDTRSSNTPVYTNEINVKDEMSRVPKGVDLKYANFLGGKEMMRYIQKCSVHYSKELDTTFPDLRRVIGFLIKTDTPEPLCGPDHTSDQNNSVLPIPCDIYNQRGTCKYPMIHVDSNQDQRIHSCSLCYYSLRGLINLHRQTKCPLLRLIRN